MLHGRGHKVLIVDDAPWVSDTLAVIFSTSGFEARAAHSAEEALETVKDWDPDLAILDVVLPKTNGVELAISFVDARPRCRILLFSGQPQAEEIVEKAAERGYRFDLLSKPIHPTSCSRAPRACCCCGVRQSIRTPRHYFRIHCPQFHSRSASRRR